MASALAANRERRAQAEAELQAARDELRNLLVRGQAIALYGSDGSDRVWEMCGGTFNGGAGDDRVGDKFGGTCTDVLNC